MIVSNEFYDENCIFCKIVHGESPVFKIWEDKDHLAFLSIFPNTLGASVVIPKKHYPSYAFALPPEVLLNLTAAAAKVGKLLDKAFEDVGRTALIYEGFGINHVHAKLFPLHQTAGEWKPIHTDFNKFFDRYEGFVSSHEYHGENPDFEKLAEHIRSCNSECACDK